MGAGGRIAMLVMVALLVFIVLVLITDATVKVNGLPGSSSDEDLQNASRLLTWTTVSCWVVLVLVAFGIGMVIYYSKKSPVKVGGAMVNTMLVFLLLMLFIMGVMAAAAASSIEKSGQSVSGDGKAAYNDCVAAAILSLTTVGLLIIGLLIFAAQRHKQNKKLHQVEEAIEMGDAERLEELTGKKKNKLEREAQYYLEKSEKEKEMPRSSTSSRKKGSARTTGTSGSTTNMDSPTVEQAMKMMRALQSSGTSGGGSSGGGSGAGSGSSNEDTMKMALELAKMGQKYYNAGKR